MFAFECQKVMQTMLNSFSYKRTYSNTFNICRFIYFAPYLLPSLPITHFIAHSQSHSFGRIVCAIAICCLCLVFCSHIFFLPCYSVIFVQWECLLSTWLTFIVQLAWHIAFFLLYIPYDRQRGHIDMQSNVLWFYMEYKHILPTFISFTHHRLLMKFQYRHIFVDSFNSNTI